jgi:hypothetical protein
MFPLHSFLTCRSGFDSMVFVTAVAPWIVSDVERMLGSEHAGIIPPTALRTQSYDGQPTLSGDFHSKPGFLSQMETSVLLSPRTVWVTEW